MILDIYLSLLYKEIFEINYKLEAKKETKRGNMFCTKCNY